MDEQPAADVGSSEVLMEDAMEDAMDCSASSEALDGAWCLHEADPSMRSRVFAAITSHSERVRTRAGGRERAFLTPVLLLDRSIASAEPSLVLLRALSWPQRARSLHRAPGDHPCTL